MKAKGLWMALMALMMCFVSNEAYAYDIEVKNADGVTIYYYYINKGKELEVTYEITIYNSYSGSVVIPEEVTYDGITRKVTSIGKYAFRDCTGLTSVHITDLAAWCKISFSGSSSNPLYYAHHLYLNNEEIKDLIIPNSVTSIGSYAFYYCSGLTSVTIPNSVTSIGGGAFWGCSGLTSVTIPNSVTSIGYYAFYGCSGLTSVTVDCTTVENWFAGMGSIQNVILGNHVTSIGNEAFRECSGLTSVTIPGSVTSIGKEAFYGCSGLTSVTIGNSIKTISTNAFAYCTDLADVYCYSEQVPATASDVFEDSYPNYSTLHVPASAINSYKTRSPWSEFKEIVALTDEELAVDAVHGEESRDQAPIYDLGGRRLAAPRKGINIVDGKKVVVR